MKITFAQLTFREGFSIAHCLKCMLPD